MITTITRGSAHMTVLRPPSRRVDAVEQAATRSAQIVLALTGVGGLGRDAIPDGHFRRAITEFVAHYHRERNHQGLENALIEGGPVSAVGRGQRKSRLGGLPNFYRRAA